MGKFIALTGNTLRHFSKLRFMILNLSTIKDIPTEQFNSIIESMISLGWKKTYEYSGFDAWIDYGKIKLKKNRTKLTFEWDNWTEGSVEGPSKEIAKIADTHNLSVSHEWRWSEYDNNK